MLLTLPQKGPGISESREAAGFFSAATTLHPDFVSLPLVPGDNEGHAAWAALTFPSVLVQQSQDHAGCRGSRGDGGHRADPHAHTTSLSHVPRPCPRGGEDRTVGGGLGTSELDGVWGVQGLHKHWLCLSTATFSPPPGLSSLGGKS